MPSLFCKWLRVQLDKRDMSVADLADAIGIGITSVYSWLRGDSSPSPKNRNKIAEVLGKKVPSKLLIETPLFGAICSKCDQQVECMERAMLNRPIKCECISLDDIMVAHMSEYVDELIWWIKDLPEEFGELVRFLAENNKRFDNVM